MPQLRLVLTLFAVLLCTTIRAQGTGKSVSPTVSEYFPDIDGNLTKVTWAHAVNSRAELNEALNSTIMMLEADIVMGILNTTNDRTLIPVMGHPPANESDISLEQFLNEVLACSAKHGVKLDFKTIEVFNASKEILAKLRTNMTFPVWINADILSGPVNATGTPVDAASFLAGAAETFPESTLSIGWTTRYGNNDGNNITEGSYSTDHVNEMLNTISTNNVTQPITYPVRAGLAAQSIDALESLISRSADGATLTIWSSDGDSVDGDKLSQLIRKIGVKKVYIDVPEAVWDKINISSGVSGTKIGAFAFSALLAAVAIVRLF